MTLTGTEQIRALSRHFDGLIRAAVVQPPDVAAHIEGLLAGMKRGRGK